MRGVNSVQVWRQLQRAIFVLCIAFGLPAQAFARPAPDSFSDLANRLLPTVVNIATTQTLKAGETEGFTDLPPDSPLQELFKDYLNKNRNAPRHVTALGSGFVIDSTGLIVTNNHVIDDADDITVTLNDGTSLPAKLMGRDPKTDLALLKVNPPKLLLAAHFGDSDKAHVGDWVIAIGNPFGLGSTVTAGIVSARNRDIASGPYDDFIQTDAPINRGNSGGPLFDMDGNVVGVNSAIFSPSGGSVGIGFSIPANMAREVVDQLRQFGQARRGWLGVRIQQVTSDIAEGLGLAGTQGALVADVTAGGPAAKAGIENGDLILDFDGKPVTDSRTLPRIVADTAIGKTVNVDLLRKGKRESVHVTVAKLDDGDTQAPVKASKVMPVPKLNSKLAQLGLTLGLLDGDARNKFHVPNEVQGALVTDVDPNSPAGEKNFRPGDVIIEIESQPVRGPDDVTRHLETDARAGRKIEMMLVSREGVATYVALRLAEG
ncbi:MAG TPA: Do family serine endopeptidase [Rhizomicrobium sp.]|nr:Do family serine endopeptidase [Rhizomicrobium sp.]